MAAKKTPMTAQIAYRIANVPGAVGTPIKPNPGGAPMGTGGMSTSGLQNQQAWLNVLGNEKSKAAARAPAAAAATPGAPAAPAAPEDPMAKYKDSTYFSAVAQNIAKRTNSLAGLQEGDSRLKQDTATSLERLARNYAGQRQNLTEGANKSGLFYSGILGKRLGDAEVGYNDQVGDVNKNMTRGLFDNEAQRKGLLEQYGNPADANDYGLSGAGLLAEAGGRYQQSHPVPETVLGRPGENGLPQGFNQGGWKGLAPGLTIEWDPVTGKAKRIVKQ